MAESIVSRMDYSITEREEIMEEKVRENRLRRMADRQGLRLVKSRRRDPRALEYGRFWLFDRRKRVAGGELGTSLEEIEAYLTREGRDDG